MLKDKRLVLVTLVLAAIAIQFWAGSRVPALNEKALMGGDTELGALGFDVVLQVKSNDPLPIRALYETVNWLKTNQRGMTFGVLFASTLMLLLSLFKRRSFQNRFANSLLGMVIGAPLGVCVNCAAPIAKGLYTAGARLETTIAAMISSPTLNIIVLTMLLSLFPLYMIAIKLALTVTFILLGIPLLTRVLAKNVEIDPATAAACSIDLSAHESVEGNESWQAAVVWVVKNWLSSFWHVFKTTVPLMFLAGFLGALLVTLLPWQSMAEIIPSGSGLLVLANMLLLAMIGIFLPVPIAFDVILVAILLAAGLPVGYAMVLLFTLGIFSIYSFFIVWREISRPMAIGICVATVGIGVGAGIIGDRYFKYDTEKKREMYFATFGNEAKSNSPSVLAVGSIGNQSSSSQNLEVVPPRRSTIGSFESGHLAVERTAFSESAGDGSELFSKYYGKEFGIDEPYSYSVMDYILSWGRFRGIAAGDVQNDGFTDLLITSKRGLALYANVGGERFVRQELDSMLGRLHAVNAALVDMNNDGWLDIVVASYNSGNYVAYNSEGIFEANDFVEIPNTDGAFLTGAMGFGDIDGDGDLDAVFGNFGYGSIGITKKQGDMEGMASSLDVVILNEGNGYTARPYSTVSGDTMSTLLFDLNDDGLLDLISANDFGPPDLYLIGDGSGNFRSITSEDGVIPFSGSSTMSIVTADIDNNLVPEIFVAQISGRAGRSQLDLLKVEPKVCAELSGTEYLAPCEKMMSIQADFLQARKTQSMDVCFNTDEEFRDDCVAMMLLLSATRWNNDPTLCDVYPDSWAAMSQACNDIMGPRSKFDKSEVHLAIPQQGGGNALFFMRGDGTYEDRAAEYGLKVGGWSWNSRFADVDNDEWLDIYIVNGDFASSTREANFFYRGVGGKKFVDATVELGFASHLETSSYAYIDFDNDGDLDIVSIPEFGPVFVYRNNLADGNSVAVELRDAQGNSYGIGSRIIVRYGPDGERHQLREIQMSGGFVSYDAPIAYFGLGGFDAIESIEIRWSTGEKSVVTGPFAAGAKYTITRHNSDELSAEMSAPGSAGRTIQ